MRQFWRFPCAASCFRIKFYFPFTQVCSDYHIWAKCCTGIVFIFRKKELQKISSSMRQRFSFFKALRRIWKKPGSLYHFPSVFPKSSVRGHPHGGEGVPGPGLWYHCGGGRRKRHGRSQTHQAVLLRDVHPNLSEAGTGGESYPLCGGSRCLWDRKRLTAGRFSFSISRFHLFHSSNFRLISSCSRFSSLIWDI